jgi:hypothetical protein
LRTRSRPPDARLIKRGAINVKYNTGESFMKQAVTYDRKFHTIEAQGKKIIDLSSVKDGSKAILYSRGAEQNRGLETTFRFYENTTFPFILDGLPMTPATLTRTIVENRLQVEGLICSDEISKAYQNIIATQLDDIFKN